MPVGPGRPSLYTESIAQEIVSRLSKGEPLAQICRDDHIPAVRTISDWKRDHEDFSADFARAREEGFDAIALDCLTISDDVKADAAEVSKAKLRVDTRLKLLAKWSKRYADKLAVSGDDEGDPIRLGLDVKFV